jgi:hypothetical protein
MLGTALDFIQVARVLDRFEGSFHLHRLLMKVLAAREALRDVGRLQLRALRGRVRGKPARDSDENPPPLGAVAPLAPLAHSRFENLQRVEIGILAQHRAGRASQSALRPDAQAQARGRTSRAASRTVALTVEREQERFAYASGIARQIIQYFVLGQARRRHVQEADQPKPHRAVEHPRSAAGVSVPMRFNN